MGWMGRAIMGMFAIVPSWMGVDFFQKNFSIRGEIMFDFVGVLTIIAGMGIIIMNR